MEIKFATTSIAFSKTEEAKQAGPTRLQRRAM